MDFGDAGDSYMEHWVNEKELHELDALAEPDKNMEQTEHLLAANEKWSVLTNNTRNVYHDIFR